MKHLMSYKKNHGRYSFITEINIPAMYGPTKVTDLRIENIDLARRTADLVFTAPGADLMDGRGA